MCGGEGSTLPAIQGESDAVDLTVSASRDAVNFILFDLTENTENATPEIMYERVRGILSEVGYDIPPVTEKVELFQEDEGEDILPLVHPALPTRQDGSGHCFLYFAFYRHDDQSYELWAEIVTESGLEEILSDGDQG